MNNDRFRRPSSALLPALGTALALAGTVARGVDPAEALRILKSVGPEGQGNPAAAVAWGELSRVEADRIPQLLAGMDEAGAIARNWIFAAIDSIAERTLRGGGKLPVPELAEFLLDATHDGRARRLAFELLMRADPATAAALVPGFLDDPAAELRREAVGRLMEEAAGVLAAGRKPAAGVLYRQALGFARDADQIEAIAKPLEELGRPVDLVGLMGFLTRWKVVGPFDNTAGAGFEKVFPPETGVDLGAEYDGKEGRVRWKDFASGHRLGMVDFNQAYAPLKEVTGYAWTEFDSEAARPAEIRLGCKNGWKVWFNGRFLFGRDEYHRNLEIDQYRLPIELRAGRNTILVKLTQNEQKEEWTVEWEFQLRVTDPNGRVIRPATPKLQVAAQP